MTGPRAPVLAGRRDGRGRGWRVLSTLVMTCLCALAAVAVAVVIAAGVSPAGTVFGHPVMTVLSGSMAPVISTGDLIVDNPLTTAQARRLRPGQIVSFQEAPGSPIVITHRIIAVTVAHGSVAYQTKGDANQAPDAGLRPAADAIGVFGFAIPRGGYLLATVHRPLVAGLLMAAPLLWLLAGPLRRRARDASNDEGGLP